MTGTPSNRHANRATSDENHTRVVPKGSAHESPAERRLRNPDADRARYSARRATELGGRAGITEGLAAIAHAILHGQEKRP